MNEDYEIDYEQECPKCQITYSHYRNCDNIYCNDGMCDMNDEDPINYPSPGIDVYPCKECKERGIIEWCPSCGHEYEINEINEINN